MNKTLVISSFVAGSNVGGSLAMKVLPVLGHEVALLPTTLLGRHPGWGAPGGGAVPQTLFDGIVQGLVENYIPQTVKVVVTGYFASAEQVSATAKFIRNSVSMDTVVLVDAIMGDFGKGLYVQEEVAEAIVRDLIPLAHIVKGNAWEFWELERRLGHRSSLPDAPKELSEFARYVRSSSARRQKWLVSSVEDQGKVGLFGFHGLDNGYSGLRQVDAKVLPNGFGDFMTLMLAREAAKGASRLSDYIGAAMGAIPPLLAGQDTQVMTELNLKPVLSLFQASPVADVRKVW